MLIQSYSSSVWWPLAWQYTAVESKLWSLGQHWNWNRSFLTLYGGEYGFTWAVSYSEKHHKQSNINIMDAEVSRNFEVFQSGRSQHSSYNLTSEEHRSIMKHFSNVVDVWAAKFVLFHDALTNPRTFREILFMTKIIKLPGGISACHQTYDLILVILYFLMFILRKLQTPFTQAF